MSAAGSKTGHQAHGGVPQMRSGQGQGMKANRSSIEGGIFATGAYS